MSEENKNTTGAAEAKAAAAPKVKAPKSLSAIVKDYGDQSAENKAKGKDPVKVSLTDKFELEFTADYGAFKKGDTAEVSELAKEFYLQNGVAKIVK